MAAFIIIILFIWGGYEAIQHYNAEKYAKKKVYGKNVNFFAFMFQNHPIISILGIFAIILLIAIAFA